MVVDPEVLTAPRRNKKMYEIVLISQNLFPLEDNFLFIDVLRISLV